MLASALGVQAIGCSSRASTDATPAPAPPPMRPAFTLLPRSVNPLARKAFDVGPLELDKRLSSLSLVFAPTPAQVADREALKQAQLDPSSPSYHHWLTPAEYAARFGASTEDLARATAWLRSEGLDVHAPSPLGARVTFSGTVAQVQRAFRTELHKYRVGGKTHYAMASAPSVPSVLEGRVLALHGAHDFTPRPAIRTAKPAPEATCPIGDNYCKGNGLAPPDWSAVYDVAPLYAKGVAGTPIDGTGVSIAIVGTAQIAKGDVDAFRSKYGLPATNLVATLVPDTGNAVAGSGGSGEEAILDVEWSGGIAKNATVQYLFTGAQQPNVDVATFWAIEHDVAPVISESWGGCEAGNAPADADVIAIYGSAANLLGITYVASAGDEGADGCAGGDGVDPQSGGIAGLYTEIPASYPGVTAVGGTAFPFGAITYSGGVATGYATEVVWNENSAPPNGLGATGGGISNTFHRPSYQDGLPTCAIDGALPTSATPSAMRQVPDVSLAAASGVNPYFIMCTTTGGDCSATGGHPIVMQIGGTSASAPAFAGVVALLNQVAGGRLGNINPMLYALSASAPSAFHDIVKGDNEIVCTPGTDVGCAPNGTYGFAATTGYDCASGLGSLDVANLASAWSLALPTKTTIASSATSTSEGADVTLTATVDVLQSGGAPLGGKVSFSFLSYLADGEPDLSWTIGEAPITSGTSTGGTATLTAKLPPGLVNPAAQWIDVVASYEGEPQHLASRSDKARIAFTPPSFCVAPAVATIAPGAGFGFGTALGVGKVRWYESGDTTCDVNGMHCSTLDPDTGAFVAGTGQPGWVLVVAIDSLGAETFAEITVGNPTTGTPPWSGDSGVLVSTCPADVDAGVFDVGVVPDAADAADASDSTAADANVADTTIADADVADTSAPADVGAIDAGAVDASAPADEGVAEVGAASAASPGSSGCSCDTGARTRSPLAPSLALASIALALARRRRREPARS